jgi:hypothetical protein
MTQYRTVPQPQPGSPSVVRPPRAAQPASKGPRPLPLAVPSLPCPETAQPVTLIAEVVLPADRTAAPTLPVLALPGWTLRLWPVARLGDATLEARPDTSQASAQDLRAVLAELGIGVLGPLRPRGRV